MWFVSYKIIQKDKHIEWLLLFALIDWFRAQLASTSVFCKSVVELLLGNTPTIILTKETLVYGRVSYTLDYIYLGKSSRELPRKNLITFTLCQMLFNFLFRMRGETLWVWTGEDSQLFSEGRSCNEYIGVNLPLTPYKHCKNTRTSV